MSARMGAKQFVRSNYDWIQKLPKRPFKYYEVDVPLGGIMRLYHRGLIQKLPQKTKEDSRAATWIPTREFLEAVEKIERELQKNANGSDKPK